MNYKLVIPLAPKGVTHARLDTPDKKHAIVLVKNFDTLRGSDGTVTWLGPEASRNKKLISIGKPFEWNGYQQLDELGNPVTVVVARKRGRPRKHP